MRRIPQLDGLRGVAVLLVVLAHASWGLAPRYRSFGLEGLTKGGGLVGVQLFFALSGFLITSILLADRVESGQARLGRFYRRRMRRLLPALLLVSVGCLGLAMVFPMMRATAPGDVFLALTYTTNLGIVAERVPHGPWLGHTWSLGVEEQFYLVWPVLLIVGFRLRGRQGVAAVALVGIVATVGVRELLDGADVYRSMRWDALLWGCWLAAVRPRLGGRAGIVGAAVLAGYLFWMPVPLRPVDYTVTAVAACLVVAGATSAPWLNARWLVYFGSISYGLYLWHTMLLRVLDIPALVTVALSIVIADLSYRFVERPVLRGPDLHDRGPVLGTDVEVRDAALVSLVRPVQLHGLAGGETFDEEPGGHAVEHGGVADPALRHDV